MRVDSEGIPMGLLAASADMSNIECWDTESSGNETRVWAAARPSIEAASVAKAVGSVAPNGASTRSLQGAVVGPDSQQYNFRDYPLLRKHAEEIRYEREDITLAEAREDYHLSGRILSDDEFDFEEDDVLFVRHNWFIPADLSQGR
jgi:hypothetical protein